MQIFHHSWVREAMFSLNLTASKCGRSNSGKQISKFLILHSRQWLRVGFSVLVLISSPVSAQTTKPLRVATGLATPFVLEENGQMTGFSIDLWRSITEQINVKSELFVNPTTEDLLSAVKSQKADVGIGNISITANRDKDFDFSQPMFESGLQILVIGHDNLASSVPSFLAVIFSPALMQLIGIILIIILLPAHIIWFFERRRAEGIIPRVLLSRHFQSLLVGCSNLGYPS